MRAAAETWQLRFTITSTHNSYTGRQRGRGPWLRHDALPEYVQVEVGRVWSKSERWFKTLRMKVENGFIPNVRVDPEDDPDVLLLTVHVHLVDRPPELPLTDQDVLRKYADLLKFWSARPSVGIPHRTWPALVQAVRQRTQSRVRICLVGEEQLISPREVPPPRFRPAGFTLQTIPEYLADKIAADGKPMYPHDVFWFGATTSQALLDWMLDLSVEAVAVPLDDF